MLGTAAPAREAHHETMARKPPESIEEAKVMASMIYEGLLDAIPGLKVVVAHGGGYFPTYMGRLDRNILKPEAVANIKGKPSDYLRHFYYDTCVYDGLALEMLFRHDCSALRCRAEVT
jgi:predicted TIM-barrel fold metal-dependent hydrolase